MSTHLDEIGLVNGCFDLFHRGHARFLWEAKKRCGYLIVAVNSDESVRRLKGPSRPFDNLHYRMDRVTAYADQVFPFEGDVGGLLAKFQPHVVFRGWDQNCSDVFGARMIQLPRYGDISTTQLEAYCERQARQEHSGLGGRLGGAPSARGTGTCAPQGPEGEA